MHCRPVDADYALFCRLCWFLARKFWFKSRIWALILPLFTFWRALTTAQTIWTGITDHERSLGDSLSFSVIFPFALVVHFHPLKSFSTMSGAFIPDCHCKRFNRALLTPKGNLFFSLSELEWVESKHQYCLCVSHKLSLFAFLLSCLSITLSNALLRLIVTSILSMNEHLAFSYTS